MRRTGHHPNNSDPQRTKVRHINRAASQGLYVLHRSQARGTIRITGARTRAAQLQVQSLATGKWLDAEPEDTIEIQGYGAL